MARNKSLVSGVYWSLIERGINLVMTTVISVVLARIIDPDHYGALSLVTVFVNIFANVLITGLGTALVQKKEPTQEDFNTIFTCNVILGVVSYLVLFFSAGLIAGFYENLSLVRVLRIVAVLIPIASFTSVHYAYLQKTMQFRKYCIVTSISIFISGFAGIVAAYLGMEIWALVIYHVGKQIIQSITLMIISGIRIRPKFSKKSFNELIPFGVKTMISTFVGDLEADVRSLVIGKVFSTADLAFYNQGSHYPQIINGNIGAAITRVFFPAFSELQDNKIRLKEALRKSIRISIYVVVPLMAGLAAVSRQFVFVLYTEKWMNAVPYIQILCLALITRPYENLCNQAILGSGRSDIIMMDMIVTKVTSFSLIICSVFLIRSVEAIAWSVAITTVVGVILFSVQVKLFFNYSIKDQLSDVLPVLLLAALMFGVVFSFGYLPFNVYIKLLCQVIIGVLIYVLGSILMKLDAYYYVLAKLKGVTRKILRRP